MAIDDKIGDVGPFSHWSEFDKTPEEQEKEYHYNIFSHWSEFCKFPTEKDYHCNIFSHWTED